MVEISEGDIVILCPTVQEIGCCDAGQGLGELKIYELTGLKD